MDELRDWLQFYRDLGIEEIRLGAGAASGAGSPSLPKGEVLAEWARCVATCTKCRLHAEGRAQTVFADGGPEAELMFVGEGPGAEEDRRGVPFVGRAGQLLTKIIEDGMKMRRADVYIANIVKCRPPGNRTPRPDEIDSCMPYLHKQIEIVDPKVVVALGAPAANALLGASLPITRIRGRFRDFRGRLLMPTFHPAYILRNPAKKRELWQDVKKVMAKLREKAGR
jgi:DNA polymerase